MMRMENSTAPMFSNAQVGREVFAESRADYRQVDFEPVAATFRRYAWLSTLLYWLPVLCTASAINLLPKVTLLPGMLTPIAVAVLVLLIGAYRWIDAGKRGWALREHDLIARHGILWQSTTTLPFARIQHVETTSGPLERAFKLARLKLFTAGGMTADLVLIGLDGGTADSLREHLAEQIRRRDAVDEAEPAAVDDA